MFNTNYIMKNGRKIFVSGNKCLCLPLITIPYESQLLVLFAKINSQPSSNTLHEDYEIHTPI